MAIQKKHGKGRLDKWYRLAKEKGYRARAAFKLIQLNKKYHFLEKSKVLIDLCAAPGSWCQVAAEVMPPNSLIVGVDLSPIKAIPRCITFQSDITTDKCRATLRQHLKTWKADTVLHDGAPNVGTAWVQDAYTQAELVLQSMKLATDFLAEGGTFVTKIFRSKDYNSLLWVFNQLFTKVEATKPPSSRSVSAEIFVVCRGYKAPKKLDPKFLDPKSVFADLQEATPNNEAKVFNPEKKKRKREGYEEGDWTQFKEVPASEFIQTSDPIAMLATVNKLSFEQKPNGDIALATLDRLPETTEEVRLCCADLKVLGRKDFRTLLRWRLKARDIFGFASKKDDVAGEEEVAEVAPMDEEMKIAEEMERLKEQGDKKKKKERRRNNEQKQKDIVRMQMHMTTPMELGMEQSGPEGEGAMFDLKPVDKSGAVSHISRGRMHTVVEEEVQPNSEDDEDMDSDSDGDMLERQLDNMYDDFQDRRKAADAKYRAKKAREEYGDAEWKGISDSEHEEESSDDGIVEDDQSDASDDEEDGPKTLIKDLDNSGTTKGLTRRAALFFDQDIFKNIPDLEDDGSEEDEDSGIDVDESPELSQSQAVPETTNKTFETEIDEAVQDSDSDSENDFEIMGVEDKMETWEEEDDPEPMKNGRPDIDIITAEAMTLAHELATGKKTKAGLADDNFNRYTFRSTDGLPDWFLDDENEHARIQRPITKAAANAIKEKLRALNARPIKKVMEAKARKKFKAARRLEKLKKKSALLLEDEGVSMADKAKSISQMMAKAAKKQPKRNTKLVFAKGGNRGISGRPKGTKGRYKMVDARLKKDVRAQKRLKKRDSKKR
ncbi:AdoMet-dependent rRNA methyltransferase spb1 [Microthyrium microscopicum]|uniref:AdoMet-dependent rRNA methyltransferase spb1 n=1 Tax=Microthyrium microscopicum TaxID=703497 RepID=A0A6A6UC79_9PEZI|nr:AdoMet-dependent rRNA methyltransferase spb1 [Microthyrium microscopicum]